MIEKTASSTDHGAVREPATTAKPQDKGSGTAPFLRHALIYGLGTFALQAASIVLLPLYTNYLQPAEFGVLELLYRIGDVLNICLMTNGIGLAALTFYRQAKDQQQRDRVAATVTSFLAFVLIGGGVLTAAVAGSLSRLAGIDNSALLAFGILVALLRTTTALPMTLMQARVESLRFVCVSLAMFLCQTTLTIAAVVGLGWGVPGILTAAVITYALFGAGLTLGELSRGSFRPDPGKIREVIRFALPFVPSGLCFFVLHNGDRFFLVRCAGAEQLGLYALGYKLAMAVGMFSFAPLMQVWSARMYDDFELPDAPVIVGRTFTRMLAAYLFVGTGLCVLKDEVIALLGSPQYAGATAMVGPLVLAYYFLVLSNLMDSAFYVRRRTGLKPWIAASSAAVMLSLYAMWIPRFGAMGAAYATLGGFCFHAATTLLVSQCVFRVRYEPGRLLAMLAVAVGLSLIAPYLGSGWATVPGKLALWLAGPVLLWITGTITDEEKGLAGALLGRAWQQLRIVPAYGRLIARG